tara:strand:- start:76 stop:609 length:534 start_codon:yes stop_codon:yes gene_type:complete
MSEDQKLQTKPKTYRFKFSSGFLANLKEFSRIHKYDDTQAFKDNWENWMEEKKEIIKLECDTLKKNGYEGDVLVKMYKSARYYFKNKSNEKKPVKKRRQYIGLNPEFRDAIDNHINSVALRQELKPSIGLIMFLDDQKNANMIRLESLRLQSYNFTKEEIQAKFKKTYKNRYFTISK